jgi:ABC-type hemin transport system substrate-binding protein
MLGEVTAKMAAAIISSGAKKILLPLNQEGVEVVTVSKEPLPHLVESMLSRIREVGHV